MRLPLTGLLLCAAAFADLGAMQANVGDLICTLAQSGERGETPPSQTRAMVCTFKPSGTGPEESYSGEVQNVGSQTALDGKRVLVWAVMGPADRALKPGLLEQTFVGDLADTTDSGAQMPSMLIGESDGSYALRPVTENGSDAAPGNIMVVVLKAKNIPA